MKVFEYIFFIVGWSKICPYPLCPTYRQVARMVSIILIGKHLNFFDSKQTDSSNEMWIEILVNYIFNVKSKLNIERYILFGRDSNDKTEIYLNPWLVAYFMNILFFSENNSAWICPKYLFCCDDLTFIILGFSYYFCI